jgi:peptidoglycan/xylan/chitin deacetylase (PgdA/CDA1 family)
MTGPGGPARPVRPTAPAPALPPRVTVFAMTGVLVAAGLIVAWMGQHASASAAARPAVVWALDPAANTVTIRLRPGGGPSGRRILTRSHLTVSEEGSGKQWAQSPDGAPVGVPVPAGRQTHLTVQVAGPAPFSQALTVATPPALRVTASRRDQGGIRVWLSAPLRRAAHQQLCGQDEVSFPASREVVVANGAVSCRTKLTLTARDGERTAVHVATAALPEIPLYSFASSSHRAIYITVDDGWTPSPRVLAIMRQTHLPVTAFLIEQAAQRDLPYWRAFVSAGGTVGDHTVSHPNLTKLTLGQATTQWGQARRALGQSLGQVPFLGRPPYGAFDPTVQAAAYRGGLKKLVGWSVVVDSDGIHTWDGRGLEPGEIVLLHWVPGLGGQLAKLLRVIHARHLNPEPFTATSFASTAPQRRSLDGD